MKVKNYIIWMVMIVTVLGLFGLTSCKRNTAADPGKYGPTGHSITLSGEASPLTLYIPNDLTSLITVRAVNYDGTPAVNKDIVFEAGAIGYFEGQRYSTTRTTNNNGVAQLTYVIGKGSDVRVSTTVYISALLVDEQNKNDTNLFCYVPIQLVPEFESDYIIISGTVTDQFSGRGVKEVVVALNSGEFSLTNAGGQYSIMVWGGYSQGWSGSITPSKTSTTFSPSSITLDSIHWDMPMQNFVAIVSASMTVDFSSADFLVGGGTAKIYIYCTPDATYPVTFTANSCCDWLQVGLINGGPYYTDMKSRTPRYLWIYTTANATGATRTGTIKIIALDPPGVGGSPLTIAVTQLGV